MKPGYSLFHHRLFINPVPSRSRSTVTRRDMSDSESCPGACNLDPVVYQKNVNM